MADRTQTGWQRHPVTHEWHFYPGSVYYAFSICEKFTRKPWPLAPDPKSKDLCPDCIEAMKKLVAKLEKHERR